MDERTGYDWPPLRLDSYEKQSDSQMPKLRLSPSIKKQLDKRVAKPGALIFVAPKRKGERFLRKKEREEKG